MLATTAAALVVPTLRNPVKALLVPIAESQMAELQALAEHGSLAVHV